MPTEPWDNPDLDNYEFLQGRMESAGDWADSEVNWLDEPGDVVGTTLQSSLRRRPASLPELSEPTAKVKRFRLIERFQGEEYVISEAGWSMNGRRYTFGPVVGRLDSQLRTRLTAEDAEHENPAETVVRAWFAQALSHPDRVVDLAARSLRAVIHAPDRLAGGALVSDDWRSEALGASAMLSSALRELDDPQRALEETEVFADEPYAPLMTSRAAALCDLDRWEDGHSLALEAQRLDDSDEVRRLLDRIRSHFTPPSVFAAG